VIEKKSRLACDGRLVKANSKNRSPYGADAPELQPGLDALRVRRLAARAGP